MDNRSLSSLLELMDQPILLRLHVTSLRDRKDLDESVKGFIALYDECAGDCTRIRKELAKSKKSILEPLEIPKATHRRLLKIASIIVVLCISGVGALLLSNHDRIEFSSTFQDPGLPNYLGKSASIDLADAMFHRSKQEYEQAKKDIEKALLRHPNNDTVRYYKAVILFENKEGDRAMPLFNSIYKGKSSFAQRALYYIGLQAVKNNQIARAKRIFKILIKSKDADVGSFSRKHLNLLR